MPRQKDAAWCAAFDIKDKTRQDKMIYLTQLKSVFESKRELIYIFTRITGRCWERDLK